VIWLAFSLCLRGLDLMPYAGPVLALCLAPVPTVYCFRFIAHFCDEERLSAGQKTGRSRPVLAEDRFPARALVPEFITWLGILTVLIVLCFTPMVLVVGSISGLLP
jgi:hypothetical protein